MPKRKTRSQSENRGITIADVAKAAGVSVPTVSRILNNKEYVADETRQRVHEVIQELGYAPHTQARRLRGGASMTLALHHPIESPTNSPPLSRLPTLPVLPQQPAKESTF
jgi:DNA-binding LacI/PurR family transcriptional regulator